MWRKLDQLNRFVSIPWSMFNIFPEGLGNEMLNIGSGGHDVESVSLRGASVLNYFLQSLLCCSTFWETFRPRKSEHLIRGIILYDFRGWGELQLLKPFFTNPCVMFNISLEGSGDESLSIGLGGIILWKFWVWGELHFQSIFYGALPSSIIFLRGSGGRHVTSQQR